VAAGLAGPGCSIDDDDMPRQSIAGVIRLDGQLLPKGIVYYYPQVATSGRQAVMGGSMIRNGRFSIPRDLGLMPGKYKVAIFSTIVGRKKKDKDPAKAQPPEPERIPPKYNSQTQLEIEVSDAHAIKEMLIDLDSG
jgi:hypothetical protein